MDFTLDQKHDRQMSTNEPADSIILADFERD